MAVSQKIYIPGVGYRKIGSTADVEIDRQLNGEINHMLINSSDGTSATTAYILAEDVNDANSYAQVSRYNSNYVGTTYQYPNSLVIREGGDGGLTLQASNASGVIRFVTGGLNDVSALRMTIQNDGRITLAYDDAYGAGWNNSLDIPTKNAIYDKIESVNNTFSSYVPYSGATGAVNLGDKDFTAGETVINKVGVGSTASAVVNLRLRSSYLGNWEYNLQNDRTTLLFRFQYQGVDKWTFNPITNVLAISGGLSYTGDLSVGSTNFFGLNSSKIQIYNGSNGNLVLQACVFNSTLSRIVFNTGSPTSTKMMIGHDGRVSIGNGTSTPTALLDINSNVIRLRTAKTPSSATDTGNQGDFCWDTDYFYICTATNTWRRVAHATW